MGREHTLACYRELGAELRQRRKKAGLAAGAVAEAAGWDRTKVSRIEYGRAGIGVVDVIHYLGICGVRIPEAQDLLRLCEDAERSLGYWLSPHGEWLEHTINSLIYHESTADTSISFEPLLVPGLLQTAAYAKARICRGELREAEVEAVLRQRMERQAILRRPNSAQFIFFVHEQALRLEVGGAEVMHEQLLHLLLTANLPNVSLRIVPTAAGERSLFGGPFRLFRFRDHQPLVYLDNVTSGFFLEDPAYVADYKRLLPELATVALDGRQSRSFAAELADAYDRGSKPRAGINQLEEEHVQRSGW